MSWQSPTGYSDPDNRWVNEPNVYDDNNESYAYHSGVTPPGTWSKFLHMLKSPAIQCSKVRFDAYSAGAGYLIDLDVYKDGAWVDVYQGEFPNHVWVEKTFTQGSVSEARMRFLHPSSYCDFPIWEFDFWQIGGAFLTGVTRDANGNPLGGCAVWLFRTSDKLFIQEQVSDENGNYSFEVDMGVQYFIRAHKDGSPNVFGTTDRNLVGS